MKKKLSGRKSIILAGILVLSFTILFSSCSSQKSVVKENSAGSTTDYVSKVSVSYDEAAPEAVAPAEASEARGFGNGGEMGGDRADSSSDLMKQRKIIMEGEVYLETKEFDNTIKALDELVLDYGGFVESRNVTGKRPNSWSLRRANYVIRVPSESFEQVMQDLGGIGIVIESNSKGTDITDSYVDLEIRLKTLKVQEETLLDILAKSTQLEDVIKLESRIAEVRYEIERIENQLRNYDRLIAFSRISINIQEVDDATETVLSPETLSERISTAFKQSIKTFRLNFENFLVWIAGAWISITFFIAIVLIVLVIYKRRLSRKKQKKAVDQIESRDKTEEKQREE